MYKRGVAEDTKTITVNCDLSATRNKKQQLLSHVSHFLINLTSQSSNVHTMKAITRLGAYMCMANFLGIGDIHDFSAQNFAHSTNIFDIRYLKGELSPNLLSEMILPGVEVPIEKLLPKMLVRLWKENHYKRRCKVALVHRKCTVTSSVSVRLYASYN